LPADGLEPSQRAMAYAELAEDWVRCSTPVWAAVRAAAQQAACSPYAVALTAYGRALSELSGADDFCVGTPVALRSAQQEHEMGCLLNTVPVRMRRLAEPDALARVWAAVVDGIVHVDLPCGQIVRAVRTDGITRRMPLYQAIFLFQNWPRTVHEAGPVTVRTVPVRPLGGQAEVQFQVHELPDGSAEGVVQAPTCGPWAGRLPELLAAFERHLQQLADGHATPGATPS
jgi:non-ribosomal peptide synthetase component F